MAATMRIIAAGPRRSFAVTVGTRPGYSPAAVAKSGVEVWATILDWMVGRAKADMPFLTGVVTPGQVLYAWKTGTGHEPVVTFAGEVSVLYSPNLGDSTVVLLLNELAGVLAEKLQQTRVYVSYKTESWILEREGGEPPPRTAA